MHEDRPSESQHLDYDGVFHVSQFEYIANGLTANFQRRKGYFATGIVVFPAEEKYVSPSRGCGQAWYDASTQPNCKNACL